MAFIGISSTILASIVGILLLVGEINGQANCPNGDNYSPCTCSGGGTANPSITCTNVNLAEIKTVFTNAQPFDVSIAVTLTLSSSDPSDHSIPSSLFGNKKVRTLTIRCANANSKLRVDPNAMGASSFFDLTRVQIQYCDLSQTDLAFINGFPNVNYLGATSCVGLNGAMATLGVKGGPLPSLVSLSFYNSVGLNNLMNWPPALVNGLTDVDVGANGFDDDGVYRFLDWLARYPSNYTMNTLYLDSNQLGKVPKAIPSFVGLSALDMSYNKIEELGTGDLWLTAPVVRLYVSGNQISKIAPRSIQGNFTNGRFMIQNNKLTRFDADVFQPMLLQMVNGIGTLFASGNPFDCTSETCHWAWLTRFGRNLLKPIDLIRCGGTNTGTLIRELDVNLFSSCPYACPGVGTFPMGQCENGFYHCDHQRAYPKNCPEGLVFHPDIGICVWPDYCF